MNDSLEKFLLRILTLHVNSLARYILEAEPFVEAGDEKLRDDIRKIAAEDAAIGAELSKFMESLGLVPRVGPHDQRFGELNYLSLRYLASELKKQLTGELDLIKKASEFEGQAPILPKLRKMLETQAAALP